MDTIINITVATTLEDQDLFLPASTTPAEAIADSRFSGVSGRWMLDGETLSDEKLNTPLKDLGYGYDGANPVLANVKNSKCA